MNTLRLILIYLAASIIILHSIIPHKHSNELSDYDQSEAFAEADGLVDYVKLLFLTDLGEGHMETFDQGNEFDLADDFQLESSSELSLISVTAPFLNLRDNKEIYSVNYTDGIPIVRQYFLSHIDFRGPPILV